MPDIPALEPVYVPALPGAAASSCGCQNFERQQQFKVKPEGRPSSPNDINRGLHASETRLEGKFPAARAH
jgi:hypothetical protein